MIALDTNLLVYAHREESPWHDVAYARSVELAEGRTLWAIAWPCIHEFLAIDDQYRVSTGLRGYTTSPPKKDQRLLP